MKPPIFKRHVPQSLSEAIAMLDDLKNEDCRILAGGQSLVPMMAFRVAQPAHLIDINEIPDWGQIRLCGDALVIDPQVRHAQFSHPTTPGPTGRLLAYVMRHIAHYPIRTRGTFCGSLAHSDPSSEWCLVASTLGASVETKSADTSRTIAADDLSEGLMATSLEANEMIVATRLPLLPADSHWGFYEFSRRPGDYAMAMSLVSYRLVDGLITDARVGLGGAEAKARRIPEAEDALNGRRPSDILYRNAAAAAAAVIEPMEDLQADEAYRRDLAAVVIRRALSAAETETGK